jgi:hypothetical protein
MATMLEHLGRACLFARREAEVRQIDIGTAAGVSHTIVGRFENGTGVPRALDDMVAAYASECDVTVVELWQAAFASWSDEHQPA